MYLCMYKAHCSPSPFPFMHTLMHTHLPWITLCCDLSRVSTFWPIPVWSSSTKEDCQGSHWQCVSCWVAPSRGSQGCSCLHLHHKVSLVATTMPFLHCRIHRQDTRSACHQFYQHSLLLLSLFTQFPDGLGLPDFLVSLMSAAESNSFMNGSWATKRCPLGRHRLKGSTRGERGECEQREILYVYWLDKDMHYYHWTLLAVKTIGFRSFLG